MIQVKKGHSSIDNVIKNTPTSLDMFLQTMHFDKIKQNCNKKSFTRNLAISWVLHRFESADVLSRTASLAKTDALSLVM